MILPFTSNFLIGIYAWMIILGPQAALNQPQYPARRIRSTRAAAVLAVRGDDTMVYVYLPFMVLPLYTNLEKHDPALLDAAQDLGANAWQRFWRVTFPLSQPAYLPVRRWCSSRPSACSPCRSCSAAPATS